MRQDARGRDTGRLKVAHRQLEDVRWRFRWTVEQWSRWQVQEVADRLGCTLEEVSSAILRRLDVRPQVVEVPGNLLVNTGIVLILDLLIGESGTVASNANAELGVGSDDTAAAAGQTDLQDASAVWQGMNDTYPSRDGETVDWQADFGDSDANFAWEEWGVRNDSTAQVLINRKVESLGTKSSGTWTLTGSLTLS